MSMAFGLLGWILFSTTDCISELLFCIVILGFVCPIYMSDIICGTASLTFPYTALIYDYAADFVTTFIIWEIFNTAPLFLGVSSLSNKKKCPPIQLPALGSLS